MAKTRLQYLLDCGRIWVEDQNYVGPDIDGEICDIGSVGEEGAVEIYLCSNSGMGEYPLEKG